MIFTSKLVHQTLHYRGSGGDSAIPDPQQVSAWLCFLHKYWGKQGDTSLISAQSQLYPLQVYLVVGGLSGSWISRILDSTELLLEGETKWKEVRWCDEDSWMLIPYFT